MRFLRFYNNKKCLDVIVTGILLVSFFSAPLFTLIPKVSAQELTPKWTRSGLSGGVSGVLIADINGDEYEEIIWANRGKVTCLNPNTGAILWTHYDAYIDFWCQPQMADLDSDGDWEVVVPVTYYLEADMTGVLVIIRSMHLPLFLILALINATPNLSVGPYSFLNSCT